MVCLVKQGFGENITVGKYRWGQISQLANFTVGKFRLSNYLVSNWRVSIHLLSKWREEISVGILRNMRVSKCPSWQFRTTFLVMREIILPFEGGEMDYSLRTIYTYPSWKKTPWGASDGMEISEREKNFVSMTSLLGFSYPRWKITHLSHLREIFWGKNIFRQHDLSTSQLVPEESSMEKMPERRPAKI